jgi:carboxypeptidase Taq
MPATKSSSSRKKKTARSASARTGAARTNPLDALAAELRDVATLGGVSALIGWDQETVMPAKGAALRAAQREMISALVHERRTSRKMGDLIAAAEDAAARKASPATRAALREIRRDYDKATRLPASLVAEMARCFSLGMEAWKDARQHSNFAAFLPWLTKTIDLSREKAICLGVPKGGELYDALLDDYEPTMTAARTRAIFGPLRERLVPLIDAVARVKKKPTDAPARTKFAIDQQKQFVAHICAAIGFDFDAGRIDESAHPFCESVGPGDTRMTNRYRPDGWTDALSTAMHESGHGMYEQGLPKDKLFGSPLAEAVSLGIHESQSRLWENLVGRSRHFWTWAAPVARKVFGTSLKASPDELYKAVNLVRPGFIRVESDELTYNLHIMLRFDLERAMIAGDLRPRDLPGAWNDRIKSDLGLTVPDDRRGCLQDVHWSAGLVGYFPTYTFGNLYASQFWEAMAADLPRRDAMLARGEFAPILEWLRTNIHAHGRRYPAEELCRNVTGKPLSHDALLRHLATKVQNVYGV